MQLHPLSSKRPELVFGSVPPMLLVDKLKAVLEFVKSMFDKLPESMRPDFLGDWIVGLDDMGVATNNDILYWLA